MLQKFKNLSKGKKIVVGIIAFILLPITLLALGIDLTINGFKNKKIGKIIGGLVLTIFMLFVFIPSGNTDMATNDNETPEEENVQVMEEASTNLNVKIDESIENENGKIRFNIKTNLPNTTELMIGISEINNGDYRGQTTAIVTDGEVQTEWFSNKGEALRNGDYELSISMSIPMTQSEEVQKVVGKNGEYLEGDLVVKDNGSSYVSMKKTITLDGGASAEEKVESNNNHKEIIAGFYNELISQYNNQTSNYNELEFGKFRADWNRRRNEAQAKMDTEDPTFEYSLAMRELIPLETEIKNKLAGKQVDDNFIKETMASIESVIK